MSAASRRMTRMAEARLRALRGRLVAGGPLLALGAAALAARAGADARAAAEAVQALLFLAAVLVTLGICGGGPSAQTRDGSALLWLQRPVHPSVVWAEGSLARLLLLPVLLLLLIAIAAAALALAGPPGAATLLLRQTPWLLVLMAMLASVSLGCSGLGIHPAGVGALIVCAALLGVALTLALAPERIPPALLPLARAVRMPMDESVVAARVLSGLETTGGAWALLRVALWSGAWIGLGLLAVPYSTRSPSLRPE